MMDNDQSTGSQASTGIIRHSPKQKYLSPMIIRTHDDHIDQFGYGSFGSLGANIDESTWDTGGYMYHWVPPCLSVDPIVDTFIWIIVGHLTH